MFLSILTFISSNISLKVSNCKKYFVSLISSNEYLLKYDLWIILLIWLAVISIYLFKLNTEIANLKNEIKLFHNESIELKKGEINNFI